MLTFTLTLPSAFSREFKRKARLYWATDGGVVGELLCFDRPQTLVQVRDAYQRHYGVYSHCEHTFGEYLAHSLLRLAEHGLTRIEPGGGVVGELLCFDRPQTLVQVRDAYQRHYGVYSHCEHSFGEYLAYSLLRLAEHGLTRIEPAVPLTLGNPAPLAFRLATPRPTTTAAEEAWQVHGGLLGRVLSDETPMTLDQIAAGCQQIVAEAGEGKKPLSPMAVAGWLLALAEAGVVEVLQAEESA